MTKCICAVCGRTVNGRVPAKGHGDNVVPYRHLPPSELGQGNYPGHDGWFGHGRWCPGALEPAREALGA